MGFCSDVKSINIGAAGGVTGRRRIKAIYVQPGTTAGSVVIQDGMMAGPEVLRLDTIANGQAVYLLLPEDGVLCSTAIFCTTTGTSTKVTLFYA